jgi:sensor c-di-GMP phosphodiesterase-like protein
VLVQGFHFSRPLPPEKFFAYLKQFAASGKE